MTTIVTRTGKGSPLTHAELDTNFTNLNTNKLEAGAIALGSAGTPSISFLSDANTGIFSPGADQVAISTNGVQRLSIGSTGNIDIDSNTVFVDAVNNRVGIGTSSPSELLHIEGASINFMVRSTLSSAATAFKWGNDLNNKSTEMWVNGSTRSTDGGASAFNIYQSAAAPIRISTNGSHAVTIDSSQRVGIGSTSPATDVLLTVGGTDTNCGIMLDRSAGNNCAIYNQGGELVFKNGSSSTVGGLSDCGRFDSSGRLLVGTSSARTGFQISTGFGNVTPVHQFEFNSQTYNGLSITHNAGANVYPAVLAFGKSRGSSAGSYTAVASGDGLGWLDFYGADGTNMVRAATIAAEVDGTPGANDMPGRLVFSTTSDSANSPTERMRIDSLGNCFVTYNILMDSAGTSGARLYINGTSNNQSLATSSSGASSTAIYIGNAAIQVSSDARLKKNIENTQLDALATIERIKVRDFTWNDPTDTSYNNRNARGKWTGLIAQELVDVLPFVVNAPRKEEDGSIDHDSDSIWTLDQSQICPVLIKAVQQQQEIIAALEARLTALETA